jgi:acyl carrier protein
MTQEATVGAPPAPLASPLDEEQTTARFIAVVGEVIGMETVPLDEHFLDIGGDSLSMAIIVDWIGQEFGTEPEIDWFFESQNLRDLAGRWWTKLQSG